MIEPFSVEVEQARLDELRRRIRDTRWPEPATAPGQGVPLERLRGLADHWAEGYDWRRLEAELAGRPQFRTVIDGLGLHFLHQRSPHPEATPLLLSHGWPGSYLEFLDVVGPLTDPTAHGGTAADAFHVVCPSLPGYGFSDRPSAAGWDIHRIAAAWSELMGRLGYRRFAAAGSDWGTSVSTMIAAQDPDRMIGIHLIPPLVAPDRSEPFTAPEQRAVDQLAERSRTGSAYGELHATKPQTIGYALNDSPVGLCAWIAEKYEDWADPAGPGVPVDRLLDTVTLYWLTGTAASSARLYWESIGEVSRWFTEATPDVIMVPTGGSAFPAELPRPSRRWAERRFPDLRYWGEPPVGGHFAALEVPDLYVAELRASFAAIRSGRRG
ncbi:epoxide hydrolase family protein [Microlunatus sp. GCM10028923]|uniref:epoxide hydrolase family protein n=1 Tax=Microlunatus sp. GCM10028923 TaxID=3273400 RepID=UPI0036155764